MRLRNMAGVRRNHPNFYSIEQLFDVSHALVDAVAEVSLLAPPLRRTAGDLAIAAQNIMVATAGKERFADPDHIQVFEDALRLYQELATGELER